MGLPGTPSPDPLIEWARRFQVYRRGEGVTLHVGSTVDPAEAVRLAREHAPSRVYLGMLHVLTVDAAGRARGELVQRRPPPRPGEGWRRALEESMAVIVALLEAPDGTPAADIGPTRIVRQLVRGLAAGRLELPSPRYAVRLERRGGRLILRRGR